MTVYTKRELQALVDKSRIKPEMMIDQLVWQRLQRAAARRLAKQRALRRRKAPGRMHRADRLPNA